jgi:hypothetical protein
MLVHLGHRSPAPPGGERASIASSAAPGNAAIATGFFSNKNQEVGLHFRWNGLGTKKGIVRRLSC